MHCRWRLLVKLHREGSAPAACPAGLFLTKEMNQPVLKLSYEYIGILAKVRMFFATIINFLRKLVQMVHPTSWPRYDQMINPKQFLQL